MRRHTERDTTGTPLKQPSRLPKVTKQRRAAVLVSERRSVCSQPSARSRAVDRVGGNRNGTRWDPALVPPPCSPLCAAPHGDVPKADPALVVEQGPRAYGRRRPAKSPGPAPASEAKQEGGGNGLAFEVGALPAEAVGLASFGTSVASAKPGGRH